MDEVDLVMGVRYKPRLTLKPGGSIGHYKITAGTLGWPRPTPWGFTQSTWPW